MTRRRLWPLRTLLACAVLVAAAAAGGTIAAAKELRIAYLSEDPAQEANMAILEKWAWAKGITLVKYPIGADRFVEVVAATLSEGDNQFDIIWHDDDRGRQWLEWLEPVDDVPGMETVARKPLDAFIDGDGKATAVPMAHTVGVFVYRTDLVSEEEVPRSLEDLVAVSKRLQGEGKVKWGYVGGMTLNQTWFTQWWSMWSNNCDIFRPIYERDNEVLEKNGWQPAIAEPCHQEVMEFWWDALHADQISPKAMTSYGRDDANTIFMAGDAAFTVVDSTDIVRFNDPEVSKVAGKLGLARFPKGPRRNTPVAWNEIWGWAIPKAAPAERKALAKELLGAMLTDVDDQVEQWRVSGSPPPNQKAWDRIAEADPLFEQLKHAVLDLKPPMHAVYYVPNWPAVHEAYSEVSIKALTGQREDIPEVLKQGVAQIRNAVVN